MPWYRADTSRARHPKIRQLARTLGIHRLHAVGIHEVLCSVPTEAMQIDGCLGRLSPVDFAEDCDFDGDPVRLWNALLEVGLVDKRRDRHYVHDFAEWAGSTKEAKRKADWRSRQRDTSDPPTRDGPGTETVQSLLRTDGRTDGRTDPDPPQPPRGGRGAGEGDSRGATDATANGPPAEDVPYEGPPFATVQPRLALVPPEGPEPHRLSRYVEAWNRGRDGSRVAKAAPAGKTAEKRDERWAKALGAFPDPADWEWCAKALAASPHHRGDNGWVADLEWLLERGKGAKLEEWMRKGRGLRAGSWAPPAAPARRAGGTGSPEALVAWDLVLRLAAKGRFRAGAPASDELGDERIRQGLRACGGGSAIANAPPTQLPELRGKFLEAFGASRRAL